MHEASSFITLTYDAEHLPADNSINLKHWQLFAKKLRKYMGNLHKLDEKKPKTFRFYHCGEYGARKNGRRPHYHAILFGIDFSHDRKYRDRSERGDTIYTSDDLTRLWGKGLAVIGAVTTESAGYVARYVMKKKTGDYSDAYYQHYNLLTGVLSQLEPEFATMSRNPGLGKTWFDKYVSDVYPHDYVVTQGGHKARPPAYYDTLLERQDPALMEKIKQARVKQAKTRAENNTPTRLAVRERTKYSQLSQLCRPL